MPSTSSIEDVGRLDLGKPGWKAIVDSAQEGIVSTDASGRIVLFNRRAEKMFGYRAAEVLGSDVSLLMPEPFRSEYRRYIHRSREPGPRAALGKVRVVVGKHKSGELFPIELVLSEIESGGGSLFAAAMRDVTELAGYERERLEAERFVRSAFDSLSASIAVIDDSGIIRQVNAAWRRFADANALGWPEYGVGENYFQHCVGDDEAAAALEGIRRVLDGLSDCFYLEYPCHSRNEQRWFQLRATRFAGDGPRRAVIAHEDVTQRKRAELDLLDAQRTAARRAGLAEVGAVTAQLAHDLGNSLGALLMQAQLIQRRIDNGVTASEELRPPLDQIVSTVDRLEHLVRDLAGVAKEQRLDLADIDVASLLDEVASLWRPMARSHRISLVVDAAPDLPSLRGDRLQLQRLLENAVKNSIEAIAPDAGTIRLGAAILGPETIRLTVADDGPGIPEHLDPFRIFETTKPEGNGLGLAVAQQIAEAHQGSIKHVARRPAGTIIQIDLPTRGPRLQRPGGPAARR
jgi:two-component system sensor kinase FixL